MTADVSKRCIDVGRSALLTAAFSPVFLSLALLWGSCLSNDAEAQNTVPSGGSTWGEMRFPAAPQTEERNNLLLEGAVEHGVDFHRFSNDAVIDAFGKVNYSVDTESLDWNRKLKLGTGVRLRQGISSSGVLAVGVKYEIDKRFVEETTLHGFQLFSEWSGSWQLTDGQAIPVQADYLVSFPGTTWGEVRYPASQEPAEEEDVILEGAIEQAVALGSWEEPGLFNIYASLDYTVDSEGLAWNNSLTCAAGVRLKMPAGTGWLVQLGVEAARERRWISDQTDDVLFVYLNWSSQWH